MVRRYRFTLLPAAVVVAGLALAPAAGAAIQASQITAPTDPTFASWSVEARSITVAGTTTGSASGEAVDIDCYAGSETVPLEVGVPVTANGSFHVLAVDLEKARGRLCRLRAVPAGTMPVDPSPFVGPLLATGRKEVQVFPPGPSEGRLRAFSAEAVGLTAGATALSVGRCGAGGFLFNQALGKTRTFECVGRLREFDDYQEPADSTRSQVQVDGVDAWNPGSVDEKFGGFPEHFPALSFSSSVDPLNGDTAIHDDEQLAVCTLAACTPTGVLDARTVETTEGGHVVTITDRYSSTDGESHALDLLPENQQAFGPTGAKNGEAIAYRFPGQDSYATHQPGEEVAFGDAAPAAISVEVEGSPDGDQQAGRGAIVVDRPSSPARFNLLSDERSAFELHQTAIVPASGSVAIRIAFVQAYSEAEVESLVTKVEKSFAPQPPADSTAPAAPSPSPAPSPLRNSKQKPSIRIAKVKLDPAKGTALLFARVSGRGQVTLSGKGIATTRVRAKGAGVVRLRARPTGRALNQLAARGTAKVRAKLAFRADGGRAAHAVRLLLVLKKK